MSTARVTLMFVLCFLRGELLHLPRRMQFFSFHIQSYKHQRNSGCRGCAKILKTVLESTWRPDSKTVFKFFVRHLQPELRWCLSNVSWEVWNCNCPTAALKNSLWDSYSTRNVGNYDPHFLTWIRFYQNKHNKQILIKKVVHLLESQDSWQGLHIF